VKEPIWLDRADCVAIHELMLAQYGGASGLRSEALLESALGKPQNRFHYESSGLAALAASYAAGIVLNHPFVDGNKRTGFMLAATFLEINGLQFTASEESVVEATVALAAGAMSEAGYADWLKANSRKPRKG
jgi:death-on-curing protein